MKTVKTTFGVDLMPVKRRRVGPRWFGLMCALAVLTSVDFVSAQPQLITVSSNSCRGPGSLDEAVSTANANPGSTIKIPSSVKVSLATCRSAINEPAYTIEVSTTIEGDYTPLPNGDPNFSHPVAVTGPQKSFTPDGNPNQECPSQLDTITAQSPGLFAIGASGVDNAGLEVTVKNIRLEDLPWLFTLRKNADLVVQDSFLNEIRNKNHPCRESMVDLGSGSTFRLTNTVIIESYMAPYSQIPNVVVPNGAIFGSGASIIQLDRVKWLGSGGSNVIYGGAGSQVDIVSSWFDDVGGFMNQGGSWRMVNSAWSAKDSIDALSPFTTVGSGARTVIEASTLRAEGTGCPSCLAQGHPLQAVDGGQVELRGTVIGGSRFALTSSGDVLGVSNGGAISADEFTWIQPSFSQNAAALRAITGQSNLLTDPPGITTVYSSSAFILEKTQPLVPGVLLDVVDNTNTPLLNPISSQPITLDVFGSPRLDGSRRDAGAVQIGDFSNANYTINARIAGRGDGEVSLAWSRPQDPQGSAVAGYKVQYRESGASVWLLSANVPGADVLQGTVSGLTNGTLHEFRVVPYNTANVDGPPSNTVSATPIGLPGTLNLSATAMAGEVELMWSEPVANGAPLTDYSVLYRESGQQNWMAWAYNSFPARAVTVSGLTNGVTYEFAVAGINAAGSGPVAISSETPRDLLYLSYADVTGYDGFPLTVYPTYANVYGTPTYTVIAGSLPAGMVLSSTDGQISGTPTSAGTFPLTIQLTDAAFGVSVSAPVTITIEAVSAATLTANYDNYQGAAGTALGAPLQPHVTGVASLGNLSFTLSSAPGDDVLPAGLSLNNATGEISGTPTTATGRVFSLNMEISDGVTTINEPFNIEITPTLVYAPVTGEVGDLLTVAPTVSPAVQAGSYALVGGVSLPAGLSLDAISGVITGTPTLSSNSIVSVEFTTGFQAVTSQVSLVLKGYRPTLTYPQFDGKPGDTVSLSPSTTDTKGGLTFSSATPLPDGLTLDPATGVITGVLSQNASSAVIQIEMVDQYQQRAVANAALFVEVAKAVPVPILSTLELALLSFLTMAAGLVFASRATVSGRAIS